VAIAMSVAVVLALGAVVLVVATRDSTPESGDERAAGIEAPTPHFAGSALPPGVRAPAFTLTDESGAPVSMASTRGRPTVVTFLYTTCDNTCPAQAQTIKGALDELGRNVPSLAIAVDPPRDTAATARRFLAKQRMFGRLRFVLGSRAQLEPLWRAYAIRPQSRGEEHQARIVLVDRRGYQRVAYPLQQATPERIAHDLRLLGA
jgi:protein SCO1/2